MDEDFCRERAKTVRELAEKADPFIRKRLLELASHYERRVAMSVKPEEERNGPQRVTAGTVSLQMMPRQHFGQRSLWARTALEGTN